MSCGGRDRPGGHAAGAFCADCVERIARDILKITRWDGTLEPDDAPVVVERVQAYCLKIIRSVEQADESTDEGVAP